MTAIDLIYAVSLALAGLGGFLIEWRRGSNLAARVDAIDAQNLPERVAALEAVQDRMRRAV